MQIYAKNATTQFIDVATQEKTQSRYLRRNLK